MEIYNSALEKYHKELDCDYITSFNLGESLAFKHDIFRGIPDEFNKCDIIYSEPFWKNGHDLLFKKGLIKYSFKELQEKINKEINSLDKPTILILGKNALKYYSNYKVIGTVMLHNYPSQVVSWGVDLEIPEKNKKGFLFNNYDLMDLIVDKFDFIGDFMCGFGNIAVKSYNKNKKFIMSDIDNKCISVLRKRLKK